MPTLTIYRRKLWILVQEKLLSFVICKQCIRFVVICVLLRWRTKAYPPDLLPTNNVSLVRLIFAWSSNSWSPWYDWCLLWFCCSIKTLREFPYLRWRLIRFLFWSLLSQSDSYDIKAAQFDRLNQVNIYCEEPKGSSTAVKKYILQCASE